MKPQNFFLVVISQNTEKAHFQLTYYAPVFCCRFFFPFFDKIWSDARVPSRQQWSVNISNEQFGRKHFCHCRKQAQESLVAAMSSSHFLSWLWQKSSTLTLHFRVYLNALDSILYLLETSTENFNFNFQFEFSTSYFHFKLQLQRLALTSNINFQLQTG